jgi:hypothetical protein
MCWLEEGNRKVKIMAVGRKKKRRKDQARRDAQSSSRSKLAKQLEATHALPSDHEPILLSDRDFDLFVEMMAADTKPTQTAMREASEFRKGRIKGSRYYS